jgi:radial spoke head protein 1
MGDEEEVVKTTYEYLDGDQESSEWLSRAGKCKVTYPNGDVYEGSFNDLKQRHGTGKYTYAPPAPEDGDEEAEKPEMPPNVYVGEFLNGKKHGTGKMLYPNGDAYYGQWANDLFQGEGSYKYANGDVYSGQWTNGQKNGQGTYLYAANNSQLVGTWGKNVCTKGRWIHSDGTSWHGNFKNNNPFGKGVYYFKNGNQQTGEYVEIVRPDAEEEDATDLVWQGNELEKASGNKDDLVRAGYADAPIEEKYEGKYEEAAAEGE